MNDDDIYAYAYVYVHLHIESLMPRALSASTYNLQSVLNNGYTAPRTYIFPSRFEAKYCEINGDSNNNKYMQNRTPLTSIEWYTELPFD